MKKTSEQKLLRVVIIGRPNVGKSTLFNRLIGRRQALVHDEPGVTRDRIVERARWWIRAKPLDVQVTDTGGLGGDRFAEEIKKQVQIALSDADAVIAVFDAQAGVTAADQDLIRQFKRAGLHRKMPFICAVNKVDAEVHESLISDFYSLGLDTVMTVSAEHGRGIDDLEEAVATAVGFDPSAVEFEAEEEESQEEFEEDFEEGLDEETLEDSEDEFSEEESEEQADLAPRLPPALPRIAIVGQPNVGKSTLTNALLGEDRMITSPIAGTTVDAIDSLTELNGKPYVLIDTAGIRRKNKTEQGIEVLSVVQAKKALERADIAILVLDGEKGTTEQDEKIGGLIEEAGCSVILMINKWDTQRRNAKFSKEDAAERIRDDFGYLKYAPILFVSAKERKGIKDLGDLIQEILYQRQLRISTKEFSDWVRKESTVHNPANAKFFLCHQAGKNPPTFVCHVNDPEKIHFSLKRHLVNALRERWGYMGTPVRLLFVEGKNRRSLPKGRSKPDAKKAAKKSAKAT